MFIKSLIVVELFGALCLQTDTVHLEFIIYRMSLDNFHPATLVLHISILRENLSELLNIGAF